MHRLTLADELVPNEPDTLAGMLGDLCNRWRRGQQTPVEIYLDRHPDLKDRTEEALALIYQEILLREQAGEMPRLEDYQQRFPRWAGRLADQFEVHRLLETSADGGVPAATRN